MFSTSNNTWHLAVTLPLLLLPEEKKIFLDSFQINYTLHLKPEAWAEEMPPGVGSGFSALSCPSTPFPLRTWQEVEASSVENTWVRVCLCHALLGPLLNYFLNCGDNTMTTGCAIAFGDYSLLNIEISKWLFWHAWLSGAVSVTESAI